MPPSTAPARNRATFAATSRRILLHVSAFHLAQLNLGLFQAPLDAAEMAEFAAALDPINAIAESSPGFVWRLTADDGGSSSFVDVPGADSDLWAPNLSVWTDMDSLKHFMYKSGHASYLRRRREWFQDPGRPINVLWWLPAGEIPTLAEAVARLDHLIEHGSSEQGWSLTQPYPAPN